MNGSMLIEPGLENVRVIGIYAHIDAGKTTTSEAILYYTGRIHRVGSVDEGNTQLDWMDQERARGITITAAAATCAWRGRQIHLIDTPGHIDFTAEVMRSIRVIDGAVIVLCGVGGVETQTETVWRYADGQSFPRLPGSSLPDQDSHPRILPRLIFVNKLDRAEADFERVLSEVKARLSPHSVALQIPVVTQPASSRRLAGVVDLITGQALIWPDAAEGQGGDPAIKPVPESMQDRVREARRELIDAICETDDGLLEQRLEGREPDPEALQVALRRATIAGKLVPVLCGSGRRRIGIQPLLDAIAGYLPAPVEIAPVSGMLPGSQEVILRVAQPTAAFCATVFKIVADPHVGRLAWVRVFSGEKCVGESVINPRTGELERIARIYRIQANRREAIERMRVGDVAALVGVKSAITGDTLTDREQPILLESIHFPDPVISVALSSVEETQEGARDRLHLSAGRLCEEDPTLHLSFDPDTREHILSGMGELHLEVAVDRLRSEYGLLARTSPFQIAYRETVRRKAEATGTYRKQTGGHGHFAIARLRVEPLERGAGVVFRSTASLVEVPEGFIRAVEGGVREALERGVLAGYPVTDVRVTLVGGRYHEIDSNSLDFHIAGSMALHQAVRQADPQLLEPVMQADIRVSEETLGTVLADFGRRRGTVVDLHIRGSARTIAGEVPLAEARGYATALRSMTQGRGDFTLEFRRYEPVPQKEAGQIITRRVTEGKTGGR